MVRTSGQQHRQLASLITKSAIQTTIDVNMVMLSNPSGIQAAYETQTLPLITGFPNPPSTQRERAKKTAQAMEKLVIMSVNLATLAFEGLQHERIVGTPDHPTV